MAATAQAREQRDQRSFLLQRAPPAMAGLIDGSLSTLAPWLTGCLGRLLLPVPRYLVDVGL